MSTAEIQARLNRLGESEDWAVRAAELLLGAAYEHGCSDLHIVCQRGRVLLRGRRDDTLFDLASVPPSRRELLVSRFKVLARLPAFVRQIPQDGRIEWKPPEAEAPLILRAAFLPTIHGENVVIRFPEQRSELLELDALGMPPGIRAEFMRLLDRSEGTILLTGPGGSGKTTTLYALVKHLHVTRGERLNFITIEDPVERDIGFAGQVQINEAQGLTFGTALRAALRQNPNVLLIGEIRDAETARIAMQAGMTGHLVLSTLHAGRVARVFTRLLSMGVEPYLAVSSLAGAAAQRLARALCPSCRVAAPGGGFRATGCEACAGTGSSGRVAIFEVSRVTESLRELMLARAAPEDIAAEASRLCVGSLEREGLRLVEEGRISRAEYDYQLAGEEPPT